MEKESFSLHTRAKSFGYARAALRAVLKTEHNAYIHLALTLVALAMGCMVRISTMESMPLNIVTVMVWTAELFNTAIEKTADLISVKQHPQINLIKDVAAAAVLLTAIAAALVECIIFIPKLFFS